MVMHRGWAVYFMDEKNGFGSCSLSFQNSVEDWRSIVYKDFKHTHIGILFILGLSWVNIKM